MSKDKLKGKATIVDIAKESGYSLMTVSRALNNSRLVREQTKNKIIKKAKELNYTPNAIARSLVSKKSKSIGLVIPDNTNPFFAQMAKGVEDFVGEKEYCTIFCNTNRKYEKEIRYIEILQEKQVDGMIIVPMEPGKDSIIKLKKIGFPFVLVDEYIEDIEAHYVTNDNFSGAVKAVSHLVKLEYEKIAHLAGPKQSLASQERLRGYKKVLSDNNIKIDERFIIYTNANFETGYKMTKQLMGQIDRPQAFFTVNDIVATGAFKAFYEMGLQVPRDIAIVGFDDIEISALLPVPLTTVRQSKYEMGRLAAELLIKEIEREGGASSVQKIILQPELIIRESCGEKIRMRTRAP